MQKKAPQIDAATPSLNEFAERVQSVAEMLGMGPKDLGLNPRGGQKAWEGKVAAGKYAYVASKIYIALREKARAAIDGLDGRKMPNQAALDRLGSQSEFIDLAQSIAKSAPAPKAAEKNDVATVSSTKACTDHRVIRMPFRPLGNGFIGRKTTFAKLISDFSCCYTDTFFRPKVIFADGGVGKTALAIELGYALYDAGTFDFVFFLNSSTSQTLETELAHLCGREYLNLPEQNAPEQNARYGAVIDWLSQPENSLRSFLIFDGTDSENSRNTVKRLLAAFRKCAVLITSRYGVWSGADTQSLGLFQPHESREFLCSNLEPTLVGINTTSIDDIATAVDHLPLALELVVSYIHSTRQAPEDWIEEWQSRPLPTLTFCGGDAIHYPVSLDRVWELVVSRLLSNAHSLLNALVFLAPRPASFPLQSLQSRDDWIEKRTCFSQLANASLITWSREPSSVSIHRILQTVTRYRINQKEEEGAIQTALRMVENATPTAEWSREGWELWRHLEPHIQAILNCFNARSDKRNARGLISRYGRWLYLQGSLAKSEMLLREALRLEEECLQPDDIDLVPHLHNLAEVLFSSARVLEAAPFHERALSIMENHYGHDSPSIIDSVNHVMGLAVGLQDLVACRQLCERFTLLVEHHVSPRDPLRARYLSNIANVLIMDHSVSNNQKADALLREAIAIDMDAHNPLDYLAALRLANYAEFLRFNRHESEAEHLARCALQLITDTLGPRHNRTAFAMHILARILRDIKKTDEAEKLHRDALKIRERTYGPNHIDLMHDLVGLAELALGKNHLAEAERYCKRALRIHIGHNLRNGMTTWNGSSASAVTETVLKKRGFSDRTINRWIGTIVRNAKLETANDAHLNV